MPRFNVATYVKEQKRLREKVVLENRQLKSLQDEISAAAKLKEEKRKERSRIREKHRRLDNKVIYDIFV